MIATALAFFARPLVKWAFGAILAGILIWVLVAKWNDFKDDLIEQGRQAGRAEVTEQIRQKVAKDDRINRTVEQAIGNRLNKFAEQFEKNRADRNKQENSATRVIERTIVEQPQIFANPDCAVPQEVLDQRNAIRSLGPTQETN